jgi:alpha-glucosidase (family GH31 glycosyl hydrolase)
MKKLAIITGFPRLPPWWSLGFHYSKWEETSAERVMELDSNFEKDRFPLDALWLDIKYSNESQYFKFNDEVFKEDDISKMNK